MISRISPWFLALVFLGLAIAAMVMPLSSDTVPYSFLYDRNEAKNDQQRLLNTAVTYSGVGREEMQPLASKLRPMEKELPVAVWVARKSGRPLAEIVELRKSERSWLDVVKKSGLKPKALFEDVEGKFPEPYKAAWIEYRMKLNPELSNEQVRDLAMLQLAHDVTGKPVADIVKEAGKGRTPEILLAKFNPAPPADEKTAAAAASPTPAPAKTAPARKAAAKARRTSTERAR
jgi:hypothetical protein